MAYVSETHRLRASWYQLRKAHREWFKWGDRGAAKTALRGAWGILTERSS